MSVDVQRILVTGSSGFIGQNLTVRARELGISVVSFTRYDSIESLPSKLDGVDAVIHLAGENRPIDESAFKAVNTDLTEALCNAISATRKRIPLVLASSAQAEQDNPYGRSKLAAEQIVKRFSSSIANPAVVFRLPGVFGKWCKPNYNSVVATFCHNLARGMPIQVNDPNAQLSLVYIDDVVTALLNAVEESNEYVHQTVEPVYNLMLGELEQKLRSYEDCRGSLISEEVGVGLDRALYATYISYLPSERFSYQLPRHADERGVFVEMLKTKTSGQFSFFTAGPGITRGGHYHHTKSEKFLVLKGRALFRFKHLTTEEYYELETEGDESRVVDTIPGWTHDITNIGEEELLVMLWANEIFDRENPDTIAMQVGSEA